MTDGTGTKTYRYDSFNRLINNMDMVRNFSISYSYDNMGNRLTEQNNKISGTVNYGYYENNQLESITDVDGMATTYVYDALQNAKNTYLANGASVTYAFDYANHTDRLLSLQTNNSHGEVLSTFSYGYDAVGNVENITDLTGKTSYNYDNLYQLTNAAYPGPQGPVSYVYDNAGNRTSLIKNGTSQNCGYDAGNEITAGYGNSFSYDGSGNMTQRTASGAVTTYSWDALNRMVIVKTPSGSITYVYDGNNHRVQKNTSQSKTNYYFDGNNVVAETDANNSLQKSYLPAISYKDKQGNKFFYIYNGHGDVAGLLDLKQSLVQSYSYDAFGAPLGVQKDSNNYRYVGSGGVYSDDDSDLEYMWNRMYDPQLGRFINRDSIGSSGGTNLYCYCANNPLKYTDTNGKAFLWDDIAAIVIGAVNGLIDGLNNGYSPGLVVLDALGNAGIADFALNAVYIGGWADPAALAGQFAFTNFLGLLHNTIDTTGPRYGSGQVLGSFFSVLGGKLFTDSIGPVITDVLNDTKAFSSPFAQAVFQNSLKNILGDVYGLVDTATGESDHLADQIIKSFSPTYNQGDLTDPNLNGSSGAG
jgi:RHS repeat-associated protein